MTHWGGQSIIFDRAEQEQLLAQIITQGKSKTGSGQLTDTTCMQEAAHSYGVRAKSCKL